MTDQLQKKIDRAIRLIRLSAPQDGSPIEVAYSGGKDSDVILQLTKEAGVNYRAIYKNTTIDPPGTIKHAKEMGAEIIRPKKSFFQLVEQKGSPSRYYRFCCKELKEYHYDNTMHHTIIGVRRSESTKRAKRYKEPTECIGTKKDPNEAIYPLLDWEDKDIKEYIDDRGIKCAPIYYDEQNNFHVERRLGCMCCPLTYRKKRVVEFKMHPKMLRAYIRSLRKYMANHSNCRTSQYFDDEYQWMYHDLFCDSMQQFQQKKNGLFGMPDFKGYLEKTFDVKLD